MDNDVEQRLRRRRNLCMFIAIGSLVVSVGVSLPRALRTRAELKQSNEELVRLQQDIVATQQKTRETQSKILATQEEIKRLLAPPNTPQ